MATEPRNQPTPLHTLFLSTNSVSCLGARNKPYCTSQQLRILAVHSSERRGSSREPYLPFCKKFSRSSFRFSPSSWSSTNLRMIANSAWVTNRKREDYLGARETWRDGGHHPGSASPRSLLKPILLQSWKPHGPATNILLEMCSPHLLPAPSPSLRSEKSP